jgi:hypothetical protein
MPWYHRGMSNAHHNNEAEHFPCDCHRPEHAYTDSLCPMCEEARDAMEGLRREKLRQIALDGGVSDPQERKDLEDARLRQMLREARPFADDAEANNQAFADACGNMSREDWDADNDWLASAGWGEM